MTENNTLLKPGDILYSSWGYDQTNVGFFEVIRTTGKTGVILRALKKITTETGMMSGRCTPVKGEYASPEFRKRIQVIDSPYLGKISVKIDSCERAYIWSGKPKYCSWYA